MEDDACEPDDSTLINDAELPNLTHSPEGCAITFM